MMASVKELKERLGAFLADPGKEDEFRCWFALVLRDSHEVPAVEALAHKIMWTFYDQKRVCVPLQI